MDWVWSLIKVLVKTYAYVFFIFFVTAVVNAVFHWTQDPYHVLLISFILMYFDHQNRI